MIKVRFAPSPTGYLHIGGARTALFNWLYSRKMGGIFILRIEDTDLARSTKEATETILSSLRWLGLNWDEWPYFQSERFLVYQKHAQRLLDENKAYYCYCTPTELEERRKEALAQKEDPKYNGHCLRLTKEQIAKYREENRPAAIRFKVPAGRTEMQDLLRGVREFDNSLMGDFIILKSDGSPAYNFAVVVDDGEMGITHVIRGDDHISNTPRQILLYQALGFKLPIFAHLPMIWGQDKTRLSKRHGATSIEEYRKEGYLPEALVNYLALLGFSTSDSQQIFKPQELIEKFSLERISKNPAIFDPEKLIWMNGAYIREMGAKELVRFLNPYLKEEYRKGLSGIEDWWLKVVKLYQERLQTLKEINDKISFLFEKKVTFEEKAIKNVLKKEKVAFYLSQAKEVLEKIEPYDQEHIEKELRGLASKLDVGVGKILQPIRVAVTGSQVSAGLIEILALMDRKTITDRIEKAIGFIENLPV